MKTDLMHLIQEAHRLRRFDRFLQLIRKWVTLNKARSSNSEPDLDAQRFVAYVKKLHEKDNRRS